MYINSKKQTGIVQVVCLLSGNTYLVKRNKYLVT